MQRGAGAPVAPIKNRGSHNLVENQHLMQFVPPGRSARAVAELSHFFDLEACLRVRQRSVAAP